MRAIAVGAAVLVTAGAAFGVAEAVHDDPPERTPIFVVVFDALPSAMLMKPGGQLDAERFPGFAELAADATWYRNATTVHDSTVKSVPAMLDGRAPHNLAHPTLADHPVNAFTLLRRHYRVFAEEEGTSLCPATLCRVKTGTRLLYLLHSRREQRFNAALDAIGKQERGDRPLLWFTHVLLPHEPLRFLPSGKVYEAGSDPEPGLDGNESFDDAWLTKQAEQRHLLQLRFTDTLLARLLARLRTAGLYDRATIVVTADHGISFRRKRTPAEPYRLGQIGWRRDLTRYNAQDVAFVPLFVKVPGQKDGAIDDGWVRTVDILPTLLRHAGVRAPRGLAGRRLAGGRARPARLRVLTNRRGLVVLDPASMLRRRAATVERRARTFGTGDDVEQLFAIGEHKELIGRRVARMRVLRAAGMRARLWGPRRFVDVDLAGRRVPANVIGWLDGGRPERRNVAVALNGRIAAVCRTFKPIGKLGLNFSAMVPEPAFRQGRNDVRLYEIVRRGTRVMLRPIGH